MVFNRNKGFFLTLDDSAAPATLELPQQESPAIEEAPVEEAFVTSSGVATPVSYTHLTLPTILLV